eukprot:4007697-Prymnesium_polylepis.1
MDARVLNARSCASSAFCFASSASSFARALSRICLSSFSLSVAPCVERRAAIDLRPPPPPSAFSRRKMVRSNLRTSSAAHAACIRVDAIAALD